VYRGGYKTRDLEDADVEVSLEQERIGEDESDGESKGVSIKVVKKGEDEEADEEERVLEEVP
jgi:hypothetical protein